MSLNLLSLYETEFIVVCYRFYNKIFYYFTIIITFARFLQLQIICCSVNHLYVISIFRMLMPALISVAMIHFLIPDILMTGSTGQHVSISVTWWFFCLKFLVHFFMFVLFFYIITSLNYNTYSTQLGGNCDSVKPNFDFLKR